MYEKHTKVEEVEGSHFFYLSDGASKDVYEKMRRNGMSDEELKDFIMMEDQLLGLEQKAVCTGIPYSLQGNGISKKIKEKFPKYNFNYHTIHLKQLAEPGKTINRRITCQA
jgi:hypothetical protein